MALLLLLLLIRRARARVHKCACDSSTSLEALESLSFFAVAPVDVCVSVGCIWRSKCARVVGSWCWFESRTHAHTHTLASAAHLCTRTRALAFVNALLCVCLRTHTHTFVGLPALAWHICDRSNAGSTSSKEPECKRALRLRARPMLADRAARARPLLLPLEPAIQIVHLFRMQAGSQASKRASAANQIVTNCAPVEP